ncbi:hypothetical protein QYF36_014391 [Acer negundo]|nr:hypothetical protein QYF36_014391 [Acer negundo]
MGEEVKLLGTWGSPFSYRVIWALKLNGIAYEYVEEDLSNKSALLLRYNPVHKKIPILVHGGKPICESMTIVEYIEEPIGGHSSSLSLVALWAGPVEEMWPHTPLLPTDPYDRTITHFWVKFAEDKGSAVWSMFYSRGEEVEKAIKESLEMLEIVEEHGLPDNGEKIGMVDIAFGLVLYCAEIKENIPDRDEMVVFYKRFHENENLQASN